MQRSLLFLVFIILSFSCRKNKSKGPICVDLMIVPYQPYSSPVWHPNGVLLGFNHTPQVGVFEYGRPPCQWYMNAVNRDSLGFYLMNKDGTGFRRVTDFYLLDPAWSPDGEWVAFMQNAQIYKMHFDGYNFDTANIIQLTANGSNFYPSWTANSDTIYYDSNEGTKGQGYYLWKIASDGSGNENEGFPNTGRQPFVTNSNLVYFIRGILGQPEIFSMNKNGLDIRQVTFNGRYGLRQAPKFSKGKLFFWDVAIIATPVNQFLPVEVCNATLSAYDISKNGKILYVTDEYGIQDKRFGTIWICDSNGSHKRQLTFNNH